MKPSDLLIPAGIGLGAVLLARQLASASTLQRSYFDEEQATIAQAAKSTAKKSNLLPVALQAGCMAGLAATGVGVSAMPLCAVGGALLPGAAKVAAKGVKALGKGVGKGAKATGKGVKKGVKKVGKFLGLGDLSDLADDDALDNLPTDMDLAAYALGSAFNRPVAARSAPGASRATSLMRAARAARSGGCCGTPTCDC